MGDVSLFVSYAHADDKNDRGRLLGLACHLKAEFDLLTGLELDVFVDRESIAWGEQWREKIDGALDASSFLLPMLSPVYFKRPECRREFRDFYSEAGSRGLEKLVLPIYYATVSDFGPDSPDELAAIASRVQYVDWRELRLTDPDSQDYRRGINALAQRLSDLRDAMSEKERAKFDQMAASPSPEDFGFLEALGEIESRLPAWMSAVEDDVVRRAQMRATHLTYSQRISAAPTVRRLAIQHRYATDDLLLVERGLELAKNYSALTIEMAPFVTAVLRVARDSSAALDQLGPLFAALTEACEQIASGEAQVGTPATEYWGPLSKLGGVFKKIVDGNLESEAYRLEGNALTQQWHDELRNVLARQG